MRVQTRTRRSRWLAGGLLGSRSPSLLTSLCSFPSALGAEVRRPLALPFHSCEVSSMPGPPTCSLMALCSRCVLEPAPARLPHALGQRPPQAQEREPSAGPGPCGSAPHTPFLRCRHETRPLSVPRPRRDRLLSAPLHTERPVPYLLSSFLHLPFWKVSVDHW